MAVSNNEKAQDQQQLSSPFRFRAFALCAFGGVSGHMTAAQGSRCGEAAAGTRGFFFFFGKIGLFGTRILKHLNGGDSTSNGECIRGKTASVTLSETKQVARKQTAYVHHYIAQQTSSTSRLTS